MNKHIISYLYAFTLFLSMIGWHYELVFMKPVVYILFIVISLFLWVSWSFDWWKEDGE